MRFVSIIIEPGHLWADRGVVDLQRQVLMCKCSDSRDADMIAAVLNKQWRETESHLLERTGMEQPAEK